MIITGVTQAHKKCVMKIKKNNVHIKDFLNLVILVLHKTVVTHLDELQDNYF